MVTPEEYVHDTGLLTGDETLERELRHALRSEGEIELFKIVRRALVIRGELANSEAVRTIMSSMWNNVAEFFETVTEADTLAELGHDHKLVTLHQEMKANFKAVALINGTIKAGKEAESELRAVDDMAHEIEGNEP